MILNDMDTLRTALEQLETNKRAYVFARSKEKSDSKAAQAIGLTPSAVSRWDDKDYLNDLANQLQMNRFVQAEMKLQDKLDSALDRVFNVMDNGDKDNVKLKAAEMVINRVLGPVASKMNIEIEGLEELTALARDSGIPIKDLIRTMIEVMKGADGSSTDG